MKLTLPDGRYVLSHNDFDELDGITGEPPAVTVVIPYFEAQADLDLVLDALTVQTHPASRLEIIVVDDGSAVSPSLAAAAGMRTRLLRQGRKGFRAAAARNLGARSAEGSVLCFLDGDTIPDPAYVATAARLPALCSDVLVVGSRMHGDFAGWTPSRLRDWRSGELEGPQGLTVPAWLEAGYRETHNLRQADARSFRFVLSAVMTCDAGFFRELAGFDGRFQSYGGEDWEFAARAYQAGAVLAHEPAAVAWHNGPDWAGRGADLAAKNAETLMLGELITAPLTRAVGVTHRFPATAVVIDPTGWSDAAVYVTVDSLLAAGDVGIWLTSGGRGFEAEPRVRVGAPGQEIVERAQHVVRVCAPCVVDLTRLIGVQGIHSTADDRGPLVAVSTTRAAARIARWQGRFPELDLAHELFDEQSPDPPAQRLPEEPDLAGWFGGWAHQEGRR